MVQTRRGKKQTNKPPASPAASRATAAQRVKNKVGSPVAKKKAPILPPPSPLPSEGGYSTDEFDIDDEEDPEERVTKSDSSVSSTTSRRERLPGHLLSQLGADINEKGGIIKFGLEAEQALAELCDKRPELYGPRGSRTRYRVGKKVDRWKSKVRGNQSVWLQILEDLKVTKKPKKSQLKKLSSQTSEEASKREIADELEEQSEQASKKVKAVDRVFSPVPSTVSVPDESMAGNDDDVEDYFPTANVDPDLVVPDGAELSKCLCSVCEFVSHHSLLTCVSTVHIKINLDCPERNREFTVWGIDFYPAVVPSLFYRALCLVIPIDIRYLLDGEKDDIDPALATPFKAAIIGPRRVRVRVPSMPYSFLHDRDIINPQVDPSLRLCMDDARHKFSDEPARFYKFYELLFPSPVTLGSSVIYEDAGDYEELKADVLPVEMRHKQMDIFNEVNYLSFFVARTDLGSRRGGEVEKKEKKNKTKQLLSGYRGRSKTAAAGDGTKKT